MIVECISVSEILKVIEFASNTYYTFSNLLSVCWADMDKYKFAMFT